MVVNLKNQKIYQDAFISNGEYGDLNSWNPSIDENEIEEWCSQEIDGKEVYVPATPLGYRDYKTSRLEGLKNILDGEASQILTKEEAHNFVRKDQLIHQYDKIVIDGKGYVVFADDEEKFFLADADDHRYSITYREEPKEKDNFLFMAIGIENKDTLMPSTSMGR